MLKKWLNLIFGLNGLKNIQTMQEWSQTKLDSLFNEIEAIELLNGILDEIEHQEQGKATLSVVKDQLKYVIAGYLHNGKLIGNVEVCQYGNFCFRRPKRRPF